MAEPDSTTAAPEEARFAAGEDVLRKQRDGCFYLGTVVQVDAARRRCLVKFGDNTDSWAGWADLARLSAPPEVLCVVCKRTAPRGADIGVCDRCGRGYHWKCHGEAHGKDGEEWICRRCKEPTGKRKELKASKREIAKEPASSTASSTKVLPYDLNSLTWDTYHRVNNEHIYCYCGRNGEWYQQMLQCNRCKQWFHERCLDCLQFPLYCGDRYYIMVCSICNHGKEFLRRLELKWVDLVHLLLFNLTAFNSKKYYDLDTIIIPYINDNWNLLQLPPKIQNVAKADRRENILSILTNNRTRFKCGREIKKRTTIWGLRVRLPPPTSLLPLPPTNAPLTDADLRDFHQANRRLHFLPPPRRLPPLHLTPVELSALVRGAAYQRTANSDASDSPCPSPDDDEPDDSLLGTGCVKKSAPPSYVKQRHTKPKRRNTNDGLVRHHDASGYMTRLSLHSPLTPPTSVSAPPTPPGCVDHEPIDTSGDETSSKSTLDLIIPPPKDFKGENNPFLALLSKPGKRKRRKANDAAITLPLPLTAVIAGPKMRAKKRQLSEKDIYIGPNGEVKRKRLRRGRLSGGSGGGVTASKTAAVVPKKSEWRRAEEPNGRRLRNRGEKGQEVEVECGGTVPSPVKQPETDLDDLKTSVNMYFGAATRIAQGERFAVKAQRVGPSGRLEVLIEWEGSGGA